MPVRYRYICNYTSALGKWITEPIVLAAQPSHIRVLDDVYAKDGLGPKQRLSIDKALRGISIEAAQVIGMAGVVGSIAVGKKADFAVLADDPYVRGRAKLRETRIKGVVFEGSDYPA